MMHNPVSGSPSHLRRAYLATRPLAAWLFSLPILGYALRIPVGVMKLPRFNAHLRRLDSEVWQLRQASVDPTGFERRMAPMDARLVALERAWRQHIPAFLNAVGTVPAFAHQLRDLQRCMEQAADRASNAEADTQAMGECARQTAAQAHQTAAQMHNVEASIEAIWKRIEFVRQEILFEMAHGQRGRAGADGAAKAAARIVAPDKIAAARSTGALRLNLGCGHIALPDYVNVDMRDLPGVDVVAEVDDLPFEPGSVDEIFSAHLVEHFPQETMRRRLLPYWRGLLRPGGRFRAITPDAGTMLAGASAGTYDFDDFREVVFGSQDYAGDYHFNLFTPDSMHRMLQEAGFADIEIPVAGRRNGKCFEFEISARRA